MADEPSGFDLTAVESDDPMTLYLREIGRYSLLTGEDEVVYHAGRIRSYLQRQARA